MFLHRLQSISPLLIVNACVVVKRIQNLELARGHMWVLIKVTIKNEFYVALRKEQT
jgi:hypothetical protein